MSNPLGALIASFGGAVPAYNQAEAQRVAQERAAQEEQRRQALEDLTTQEALSRMGAHAGAPPGPPPITGAPPSDAALMNSVGNTPDSGALDALTAQHPTPSMPAGNDPLTGAPTPQQNFALPASLPSTSPAISALAAAGAPKAPLPTPTNAGAPAGGYQHFNLRDLNGDQQPYYIDPNDTQEARTIRQQAAAQGTILQRQSSLDDAKAARARQTQQAQWQGDYTTLKRVGYFGADVPFDPNHNYTTDFQDYMARKKDADTEVRTSERISAGIRGGAALGVQQHQDNAYDAAEGWFNQIYSDPQNKDRAPMVSMYNALRTAHPTWTPQRIMLATQSGMKLGAQQFNTEARTAGTNETTRGKTAIDNIVANVGTTPAGGATAAPGAAPVGPDPAYAARVDELKAARVPRDSAVAILRSEGWNLATGRKATP